MYDDELYHYGTPHCGMTPHSGRYPYGSGLLGRYRELKARGLSKTKIAEELGISTTRLVAAVAAASEAEKADNMARVVRLKKHGYSNSEIARKMGVNEGTVRYMLKNAENYKMSQAMETANMLKKRLESGEYLNVGTGVEYQLGITKQKLAAALEILRQQGYTVVDVPIEQMFGHKQYTHNLVLANPGVDKKEINQNIDNIKAVQKFSTDGGKSFDSLEYPASMDSSKIYVRYGDQGGTAKDGTIEVRPGVDYTSLGNSNYAQVRILIDGTHYAKGMAYYSDEVPEGYDIVVNSNKPTGSSKDKVFKAIKTEDPDNPFGAALKVEGQIHYIDENGNRKLGVMNKLKEEGDWDEYSKTISKQMLSKQGKTLIASQLKLTYNDYMAEYDDIMHITNPEYKEKLLREFADKCDASAVHLKASAFPGQSTKVILPLTTIDENECYAPTYETGTKLALIRYPHGGQFEIPIVTVNNNSKEGKSVVKSTSVDAMGISSKTASILSGADFDGDTVTAIPLSDKVQIKNKKPFENLKNFNPEEQFGYYEGMHTMPKSMIGKEMGKISNLITDMTLLKAPDEEIERAVKHSMVVIDAYKHKYNYKLSEQVNGIKALKDKYQEGGGVSTLISRSNSRYDVPERKANVYKIDPDTGEKSYYETGREYAKIKRDKNGDIKSVEYVKAQQHSSRAAETKDMFTLVSGTPETTTPEEKLYAQFGNQMKSLANQARKSSLTVGKTEWNKTAAKTYAAEVSSVNDKIKIAYTNKPNERQAQIIANAKLRKYREDNAHLIDTDEITDEDIRKFKTQTLVKARVEVGSDKKGTQIHLTDKEYEAIMAGAFSSSTVKKIIDNTDSAEFRRLASPKPSNTLSVAKINLMRSLSDKGATIADIATRLNVSPSTVSKYLKGDE